MRKHFSAMGEEEIDKSERVVERIAWNKVREFDLKPGKKPKLRFKYNGRKAKMVFSKVNYEELKEFLSSKAI